VAVLNFVVRIIRRGETHEVLSRAPIAGLFHPDLLFESSLVLLQSLRWCCIKCVIHHERDVREEQHHTYIWREQAIIE